MPGTEETMKKIYYNIPPTHHTLECYIICDSQRYVHAAYICRPEGDLECTSFGWHLEMFHNHGNKKEVTKEEFETAIFLEAI